MFDCNFVKQFKAVDNLKCFAVFLDDAKPPRSVQGVEWFVYSGVELALDDFAYFFVDPGQNKDIALCPWFVWNCRYFYGQEEVFSEVSVLLVGPCKPIILEAHEMVHEHVFFW